MLDSSWDVATVIGWYRNGAGRVAQNRPFSLLEYWESTRHPRPGRFEVIRARVS
ncbi:MAG: hypothetical protein ACO3SP_08655 [Ilumatobacteraceae bacterium]